MAFTASTAFSAPAINSGSPACDWPHNVDYPFGLQPNHVSFASMNAAVSTLYVNWYAQFVTATGAGGAGKLRVQRDASDGNDTVSEGIGYGMLIAVTFADKTLFDSLWAYAKQYMPDASGNYLMNWKISSAGTVTGTNGATDADLDMAQALLMADRQWGSGGAINYKAEYQNMVNAIWTKEIGGGGVVLPGDAYTTPIFSSYMTPAWFRCWGAGSDTNVAHNWTTVNTWIYNTFFAGVRGAWPNGMVPNCVNNAAPYNTAVAIPGGTESATTMGYDGSRFGWRIGLDYVWYGQSGTQIQTFANTLVTRVGASSYINYIQETWNVTNGNPGGSPCSSLQIGPAAVAAMSINNQSFLNNTYDELLNRINSAGCPGLNYFQDTLALMSLLVVTGNFPNMVCGGGSACVATTPVPTSTPAPCFMLDNFEDGNTQDNTNGYWFTFSFASLNNTPVSTVPPRSTVSTVAYLSDGGATGGGAVAGSSYAGRVSGYWMDNGQGTPATYGGFAIAAELNTGYRNLTSPTCGPMTMISFYVKTSAAMTMRLNFFNPAIDVAGGGNGNQYGYTFPTTTGWQLINLDRALITCQDWGVGTCPPVSGGVTYTRDLALSNILSLQFQTQGGPATIAGVWVDQVCMTFQTCKPNTPTPLPTFTPLPGTPSNTPTNTPTLTRTPTNTFTPMANTNTFTPTLTFTQTPTPTNTRTNTATFTTTFTNTRTNTSTFTSTFTPMVNTNTPTPTASFTNTRTNTATFTPTFTNTRTNTSTFTNTFTPLVATNTPTNTATNTATFTPTRTNTATFTATFTNTRTNTPTNTATFTNTPAITNTPTNTSTITPTPTRTNTPTSTSTFTNTRTSTPSFTSTFTPLANTNTPTNTATFTNTRTNTATFTSTFTNTRTNTPTFTNSFTNTPLITNTPTNTGTFTFTFTNTRTSTSTFTPTSTGTPTFTFTFTNTRTSTSTFTNSSTPTSTFTFTNTRTNTPTFTHTFTNTVTHTPTFTNTRTNTATFTHTFTPTITFTPTLTFTGTQPPTNTPTNTLSPTNTATSTRTFTPTFTVTNTSTPSFTATFTNTRTNTPTFTHTNTLTNTRTSTPTFTAVFTNTPTFTGVFTNSPTNTATFTNTRTNTPTFTQTFTNTITNTPTLTNTRTNTPTFTHTLTPTITSTPTQTFTGTAPPTNTPTNTGTFTSTFTNTRTNTPTFTSTSTNTPSFTNTRTNTPIFTNTSTNTPTRTNTSTSTSTNVPTNTPTAVIVTVASGPSSPSNSTQLPGASNIPVLQFQAINPSSSGATLTSVTLTASGTGNDQTGITGVSLYLDVNSNGIVDGGDLLQANGTYPADNGNLTLNFSNVINPSSSSNYLVVYNFSGAAPTGTYVAQLANNTSLTGMGGASQPLNFTGAPVTGATITIATATSTPTNTFTITPTPTRTPTPTPVVVQIAAGAANPSGSTQLPGASVPMLQIRATNNSTTQSATVSSLQLTAAGSGNDAVDINSVVLYLDANGNGIVDGGDALLASGAYLSDNGTVNLAPGNSIPPSGIVNYLVVYNFSGTAPAGNFQANVTANTSLSGTSTSGQPLAFTGAPISGSYTTLASATATATATNTTTAAPTRTPTPSPTAGSRPVVYPNPADGTKPVNLQISFSQATDSVTVQIFTVAFRKVHETTLNAGSLGVTASAASGNFYKTWQVPVPLNDKWGTPLASGLYYVVVSSPNGNKSVTKLLVVR